MPDYPEKLQETVDTLALLPDRADRIQMLIDVADRFQEVPESIASRPFPEEHRVPACESEAFVWAEPQGDGTFRYHFAVENPQGVSAMALAVILGDTLSGLPPEQVAAVPSDVVYEVFGKELSMGKSMGLMGMVSKLQAETKKQTATS
ncbi:MAG TPA: SufE family protein [Thermoanaerobaculia bacterium]|nr:SufE family protein [Thermoanaerobaculia bacterium]